MRSCKAVRRSTRNADSSQTSAHLTYSIGHATRSVAPRRLMLVHFHHAVALHVHSTSGARTRCGRADCKDRIFDIDCSGFFKFERGFDRLAFFERMLEVAEHHVKAFFQRSRSLMRPALT